ncbi:MAG: HD domain-containing protein, partial [Firmicutes bacterium]|nr:HD domain-containing protein [Bacillota bacterium]
MDKRTQSNTVYHLQRFADLMTRAHPHLLAHSLATARLVEKVIPHLPWGGYASPAILLAGAFLHDAGKITWPTELFTKYPLEVHDWGLVRAHPVAGANLVRELWPGVPEQVVEIILQHHERPGGKGYPRGVEPGYPALVVAACEVADAMTHDRGYREALPVEMAVEEISRW